MIRPTLPSDTPALIDLSVETNVFKPIEIVALGEVLDDYHAHNHAHGHVSVTFDEAGKILGYAYYAPAAMTDRTWYLYWIAVTPRRQGHGIGGKLLEHAEHDIGHRGGRLLLIETSSLEHYGLTRKFYTKHRYKIAAVVGDFYADGDDMMVFGKRL